MFLVLHGQTEWNAQGRVQGHLNSPLTDLGRQQAATAGRMLCQRLSRPESVLIISSPLGRTMETAQIVAGKLGRDARTIQTNELLKEVFLGQWEGLTHAEVAARWPDRLVGTNRHDWYFRSPDGESYADVAARLQTWLKSRAVDDDFIIVTHGIASRVLRGLYEGLAAEAALQLEVARDAAFQMTEGRVTKLVA